MRRHLILLVSVCVVLAWSSAALAAQGPRKILALGSTAFLSPGAIQAEVVADLGSTPLKEIAVIVIANQAFGSLPGPVQQGLEEYVMQGGALLLAGGPQAFGGGSYQAVASVVPFTLRSGSDWRNVPFRLPIALQAGHPILAGVSFITIGAINDLGPRPGATEILQAAGAGIYPLIAEIAAGSGRVIGMAFDLNDLASMRDRDRFVQNTLEYLLGASQMGR